jgi:hypothetical protein
MRNLWGVLTGAVLTVTEMKEASGTFVTLESCKVMDRSVDVIDEDGRWITTFVKGCIPLEIQKAAEPGLLRVALSGDFSSRPDAGGEEEYRIRQDGLFSERRGVPLSIAKLAGRSGLLGHYDYRDENGEVACRQTRITVRDFAAFENAIPLMHCVSEVFRLDCPERFEIQMHEVLKIAHQHRMGDLCWGLLTCNFNARGAIHVDKNDLVNGSAGFTAQSVGDSDFQGAELILPRYQLAFDVRMGDCLFFDPHLEHANGPLIHGPRLSVVYYTRERMSQCKAEE